MFKKLVVDARAVSQHETESWGNELNHAIEKLQSMTDNSSEAAKVEMRAREEAVNSATKEHGAIVVEIEGYDKLQGVVVINAGTTKGVVGRASDQALFSQDAFLDI